jgi:Domain of unknown function (DUF4160)
VPRLSYFYGISIYMYFKDHPPPHFHARYAGDDAQIDIRSGEILSGSLPRRASRLVDEWRLLHLDELELAWNESEGRGDFARIDPLP